MDTQNVAVKIPFVGDSRFFMDSCMTALPDDNSFAIIGGWTTDL
jgi:hypothetical protein